ncbi:MAG: ABC transporter substrate-binding protein, partial [Deltaproteobacteria bacterium]|nr:ABC transporter substrate-binding protein [Deltaproteobacteria bacterium]
CACAPNVNEHTWRCATAADCAEGYQCDRLQGVCVVAYKGENGVFEDRILLGMSAPLDDNTAVGAIGQAAVAGVETCFAHFNSRGGVHGRQLELKVLDDGYDASRTSENVSSLIGADQRQVFALMGVIGTGPSLAARVVALEQRVLFFGPATGFDGLEPDPPDRYIFNIRPRYSEEAQQLTRHLLHHTEPPTGKENIALFAQGVDDVGTLDDFGRSGARGVVETLKTLGVAESAIPHLSYRAGASSEVGPAVTGLLTWLANSDRATVAGRIYAGVVMVALGEAALTFLREVENQLAMARRGSPPDSRYGTFSAEEIDRLAVVELRFTTLSVLDSSFANALAALGKYTSVDQQGKEVLRHYGEGLVAAIPVPPLDSSASGVLQYRTHMQQFRPEEQISAVSLEAYIGALLLVEGLRRHGRDIIDESVIDTLEELRVDFGIGTTLEFSKNDHQASSKLWGAQLDEKLAFHTIGALGE